MWHQVKLFLWLLIQPGNGALNKLGASDLDTRASFHRLAKGTLVHHVRGQQLMFVLETCFLIFMYFLKASELRLHSAQALLTLPRNPSTL